MVKHPRDDWLVLANGHLTTRLFARMPGRIAGLPVPTGRMYNLGRRGEMEIPARRGQSNQK